MSRALRRTPSLRSVGQLCCVLMGLAMTARAVDWSGPERQLAGKIVAVTGAGAITLTVENRSSLGRRDSEVIQNGLRSALESAGIRFARSDRATSDRAASRAGDFRGHGGEDHAVGESHVLCLGRRDSSGHGRAGCSDGVGAAVGRLDGSA